MTAQPPSPKRPPGRAPFPHATDYVAPVIDIEEDESPNTQRTGSPKPTPEEPFPLHSGYVPTLSDISEQIASLSTHLVAVHSSSAQTHEEVKGIARDAKSTRQEVALLRQDVGELRGYVMGDHAPRITAVEAKTRKLSIPPAAKAGVIGSGAGGMIVFVVEVLVPLLRQWLESK